MSSQATLETALLEMVTPGSLTIARTMEVALETGIFISADTSAGMALTATTSLETFNIISAFGSSNDLMMARTIWADLPTFIIESKFGSADDLTIEIYAAPEAGAAFWRSGWFGRLTPGEIKTFRYGQIVSQGELEEAQEMADHDITVGTLMETHKIAAKPVQDRMLWAGYKGRLHRYEFQSQRGAAWAEILQLMDYYLTAGER
jgi:hypothetical protein